ncbi:MAG TPA: BCAM0308 family protein [Candidatus Limnocylindria bacterium]|nr:BCAM0308 family protein [Candidatus Limnocylindria bacterium]
MRSAPKRYNTTYKKKIDIDRDTYLPKRAPKETIRCAGCGAFYHRRYWTLTAPTGFREAAHSRPIYCPACAKTKDRRASGEVHLVEVAAVERGDVLRILRNEERRAREKNPLERIMQMEAFGNGWKLHTTTEKLAQRLGRAVKKARGGKVVYKWSHNNKFVQVIWQPTHGAM